MHLFHRTLQLTMDNKEPKRCSLKVGLKTKLYILSKEEKLWELIKRVFLLLRIMHLCEEQQNTTLNPLLINNQFIEIIK